MPTFTAMERLKVSSVGRVEAGQQFTVDDGQAKRLQRLEKKGLVVRSHATPVHRAASVAIGSLKALVGYENKGVFTAPPTPEPPIPTARGSRR